MQGGGRERQRLRGLSTASILAVTGHAATAWLVGCWAGKWAPAHPWQLFCRLVLQVAKQTSCGVFLLGTREDMVWPCSLQALGSKVFIIFIQFYINFIIWEGKGKLEWGPEWPIPVFYFFSWWQSRSNASPCYSRMPIESSCVSLLAPCWHVTCWSCLLVSEAVWRQMEYLQCPDTAWCPALYSWTAPHLISENREQDRNNINYISTLGWPYDLALSDCSHPDASRFGVCLMYIFLRSTLIKYQGRWWLVNIWKQLKVKHKMQRTPLRICCLSKKLTSGSSDSVLHFISHQRHCQTCQKNEKESARLFFCERPHVWHAYP